MLHVEQYKMFHVEQCKINVPRETMQNVSRGTMHKKGSCFGGRGQWLRRRRATAAALGAGGSGYGGGGLRQLLVKLLTETGDAEAAPPAPKAADGARRCRSRAPCPQSC